MAPLPKLPIMYIGKMKYFFFIFAFIPTLVMGMQEFVCLTNPKSGTHLCIEILKEISGLNWLHLLDQTNSIEKDLNQAKENSKFLFKHTIEENEIDFLISKKNKFIFLYRDPRDQLISQIFWVMRVDPTNPICKIDNINDQITALIAGRNNIPPFCEKWFLPLYQKMDRIPSKYVFKVKFEDIIGSKGGGCDENQVYTLVAMANFLDIDLPVEKAQEIANKLWGREGTFRNGKIGDWKNHFNSTNIQLYKEKYGQMLIDLGYEKDMDW